MGARLASALALALAAQAVAPAEAKPPTRLFAEDQPIKVILRGPISAISSSIGSGAGSSSSVGMVTALPMGAEGDARRSPTRW